MIRRFGGPRLYLQGPGAIRELGDVVAGITRLAALVGDADVLARYAERGVAVVRTDGCGAWLWQDGVGACTRDVRRRYWHAAAPVGGANVANSSGPGAPPP
jgi:hypothetical protein